MEVMEVQIVLVDLVALPGSGGINIQLHYVLDAFNIYAIIAFIQRLAITVCQYLITKAYRALCSSNFILPEVQKAFHGNITKLSYPWKMCRGFPLSVLPIYKERIATGLRVYVDIDCNTPPNIHWIAQRN
ncbi:hypothetical protein Tco_0732631 [Tanacetum coccineum]